MVNRKIRHIPSRLACSLVAAIVAMSLSSQEATRRPALVVGIMVEGLSEDHLQLLKSYFTEDGFRRLMDHGVVIPDVDYGENIDFSAATAMLFTGASPAVNGVPSTYVYDPESRRTHNVLGQSGSDKPDQFSPRSLLVSTISDELRIDAAGTGFVYAIAPDAERSVIMAGHAGNSAVWVDELTGKWATSSYYRETPQPVSIRNYSSPLAIVLDTASWVPSMPLDKYPDLPAHKKLYPYRHVFQPADKNRFRAFKASPLVNTAVTALATDYLTSLKLGARESTDMLNLAYTVAPYPYTRDADSRVETMDAYLRLDRDLSRLFKAIDASPAGKNAVIFLAGTPARSLSKRDDEKWSIPHGEFSAKKAISLLNMYLIALHGNGEWVTGYHNAHFYLNHSQIKSSGLSLRQIREESAEFLARMSGVSEVFTIDEIAAGTAGDNAASLKRNTSLKHAGDLMIMINPGWEMIDDDFNTEHHVARTAYMPSPVYMLAPGIDPHRVDRHVDARAIAPTLARIIRIRAPNGASLAPVRL